ncbi:putative phospholipase B-like lamina ancestor [Athalia rosae]|uniref:putative phospholipase B-like lamina ancestor n=1 Tax=Athalia rosae TaxID=37344 RepID=UPI0020340B16|nr:putative phospholipase B-like lamina ancestor [Athalia rosae]
MYVSFDRTRLRAIPEKATTPYRERIKGTTEATSQQKRPRLGVGVCNRWVENAVVGASWLQTRISTYILVAVALLGIGAIILGEFGRVENDGTYAATVTWKHNGGYRIDFWGQGNDLNAVPSGAARAYYKTEIHRTGWSVIEIESSDEYPDTVQAYSAGLLEGSLTWQLIHHHWHNTIGEPCAARKWKSTCAKIRQQLVDNSRYNRERADIGAAQDPYWHMIRLFYAQLDGMEAGWRFAVRRSRRSVEIEPEDFLWLAMASDVPWLNNATRDYEMRAASAGMTFLKFLNKPNGDPFLTLAHNTAAPFAKMLRLLKRYDLAYHISSSVGAKSVPGRSVVMPSYPGALSSQDEYYAVEGVGRELLVAGTPLTIDDREWRGRGNPRDQRVPLAARVMTANRLAIDGRSWARLLALYNSGSASRQWLTVDPRINSVWLVEQVPGMTHAVDYSKDLDNVGFVSCTGTPVSNEIRKVTGTLRDVALARSAEISRRQMNVTTPEGVTDMMRAHAALLKPRIVAENFTVTSGLDLVLLLSFRGDLDKHPLPVGVIDTKIMTAGLNGIETFKANSGPTFSDKIPPFNWTETFPNQPHCGQPDAFNFGIVTPNWVWI